MSSARQLEEYNRAVEEVARATGALGLEDEADGFPPLPRLNIGGAEFQTRIAVLRSQPGSLLTAVFMGEEDCEFDDQGRFFFDHDPADFHSILEFMRTGDCALPYERGAFETFRKQVEYWRLDILEARCDVHYAKHIKPFITGEKSSSRANRKGVNGRAIAVKALARQREAHGPLVDRLLESVHSAMLEGAGMGFNTMTLTAYRPPETIGKPGLPLWKAPESWPVSNVSYCWDPTLAVFFTPVHGFGALVAASEFMVTAFAEKSYRAVAKQDATGFSYEVSGILDDANEH